MHVSYPGPGCGGLTTSPWVGGRSPSTRYPEVDMPSTKYVLASEQVTSGDHFSHRRSLSTCPSPLVFSQISARSALVSSAEWNLLDDPFNILACTLRVLSLCNIPLFPLIFGPKTLTKLTLLDHNFDPRLGTLLEHLGRITCLRTQPQTLVT